jgi:HEAT repeat protein
MAVITVDHELLFGLLALQNGLIDPVQLVAAFQAWTRDKARPLAEHLVGLGSLGAEAAPAVPMLITSARDMRADIRENAVHARGLIGPKVEGVLPVVRTAMGDPDERVRNRASSAMATLDGLEIAKLIESLHGRDARARQSAADALREIGPKAAPPCPR